MPEADDNLVGPYPLAGVQPLLIIDATVPGFVSRDNVAQFQKPTLLEDSVNLGFRCLMIQTISNYGL